MRRPAARLATGGKVPRDSGVPHPRQELPSGKFSSQCTRPFTNPSLELHVREFPRVLSQVFLDQDIGDVVRHVTRGLPLANVTDLQCEVMKRTRIAEWDDSRQGPQQMFYDHCCFS